MDKTCGTCERCDNKVSSQHLICQQCYDDDAAYNEDVNGCATSWQPPMTPTPPRSHPMQDEVSREQALIERIAKVSNAIGMQAGVGAMETAGSIISFLAANPHYLADFLAGGSVMDWPIGWHAAGCLSWHGQDGKIHWPGEREAVQ